ncbi:hypothetical protein M5D96_010871 [Drosophila gunungcola]|uniref:Uncharacterized protein n=1 Tax=Drosophila gunungcola TaxID=103775 RepID=A0A9P9YGP7_9MUSC|nr:hypothetical protein M5D96_010871 [Drosophila gunungcola]
MTGQRGGFQPPQGGEGGSGNPQGCSRENWVGGWLVGWLGKWLLCASCRF